MLRVKVFPRNNSLATLNEGGTFAWGYLPGSHLKSSLTYPNGLTAAWSYEPSRDLLTQVVNAQPDGTVISSYTYTNDLLGRRTSKNTDFAKLTPRALKQIQNLRIHYPRKAS